MELIKDTVMEVGWLAWQARPPQASLTVVVKATYAIPERGPCELAGTQALPTGDVYVDDDPELALALASDVDPTKPAGELLVVGHARAPDGVATPHLSVAFKVGAITKQLALVGDRVWDDGRPTAPTPFLTMPLDWGRSFGGPGVDANPLGRGVAERDAPVALPNIEDPTSLVAKPTARPTPVGCGPIPRTYPARLALTGTYDAAWLKTRYPWFPEDLDPRYFLAAPPDQRVDGFFRGDEEVVLRGLHPTFASVRCQLPGDAPRVLLVDEEGRAPREIPVRLDTLTVDAGEGLAYCVWRGMAEIGTMDVRALHQLFVTHEPLASPSSVEALNAAYRAELDARAAAEAAVEPEAPPPVEDEAVIGGDDAPDARWRHLDQAMTLQGGDANVMGDLLQRGITALEKGGPLPSVFDDALKLERPLSADRQLSPEELLELEMMHALGDLLDDDVDPRREEVRAAVEAGESLRGRDLSGVDLSGLWLVDADLREAILVRANLSGAQLEQCRLDGANLSEAELSLASFDGCVLVEADLSGARAHRVRAHATSFKGATISGAYLREAVLASCGMMQAALTDSDLTEADVRECDLSGADLSKSRLDRAVFTRCTLVDAWLESGAVARGARFDGCDARLLRASEGADLAGASFRKAQLDGARFGDAKLSGARFDLAHLRRADFDRAALDGASFVGCDLREARFDRASAVGASFLRANLMEARLEGADLRDADLRGVNLYRAEVLDADLSGARLDLADRTGTRIEGAPK